MDKEFIRDYPQVSVLVPCWNSILHLPRLLNCLTQQTLKNFEVIIVDNGSTDNPNAILQNNRAGLFIRIEILKENVGFTTANNIGARLAHGRWLALLNTDAFPESTWLEKLLQAAEENPDYAAFSSRQIQFNVPDRLDGAGDAYHISGLAWRNDYQLPVKTHGLEKKDVFSACGAAALYSREAFLSVSGFDEDYFSYFEDVDLGFRLRLIGEKCLYVPEAVVHHVGSASTGKRSDFSVYYGYRNMIWTFFKNMPSPLFWIFLPLHMGTLAFFVIYLTLRGQGKVILKALWDAIRGLPKMLKKRQEIQRNRKITSRELLRVMSTGLFEPYREFIQRNKKQAI